MPGKSPRIPPAPTTVKGALAQLVERFNGIEEVNGSTPLCSSLRGELAEQEGGCVAAQPRGLPREMPAPGD